MDRVLEFVLNHPLNVFVFLMMVLLLVMHELRRAGKSIKAAGLVAAMNQGAVVIDLRPVKDFEHGHIINSVNHPFAQVGQLPALMENYKEQDVVLVCANGRHSTTAQHQLKRAGYEVARLAGGLIEWSVANLPLEKGKVKQQPDGKEAKGKGGKDAKADSPAAKPA